MKTETGMAQGDSVTDSTTIEVMLSPQQMGVLAKGDQVDAMQHRKSRLVVGAGIAAVLIVLGSVAHLAAKQAPLSQPVVRAPKLPPLPTPIETPAPSSEPVLYKNPFDHSEVFEFPAGTTQVEAHDAVARMLIERAEGRGPEVLKLKIHKVRVSKAR